MATNYPTVVITHHTGGTDANPLADSSFATVKDVDSWHRVRWPDFKSSLGYFVGYHYFISKDGTITQTRRNNEEGAHVIGMNTKSIGVCFAGNFDLTMPTDAQLLSWYQLYGQLLKEYPNIPTRPHRAYATKTCHGKRLDDNYFAVNYQRMTLMEKLAALRLQLASLLSKRRMR